MAVYTDEFNVPSSTLGAIDFKPMCENVAVDLQKSDSDDSIEDKSGSGISVTSDVTVGEQTLSFKISIGRILVFDYENEKWELKFTDEGATQVMDSVMIYLQVLMVISLHILLRTLIPILRAQCQ